MSKHCDFVEIGTSDFDTLIEMATPETVGISVEPIRYYLERLPNPPGVTKVCAAISAACGYAEVWWLPPDRIEELGFMPDYRGCNSFGKPHPTVLADLRRRGLDEEEFVVSEVPVLTFVDLVRICEIGSIKFLKIDTEGHDCTIIHSLLDAAAVLPETIKFESNTLTPSGELAATVERLGTSGYRIREQNRHDTIVDLR